MDKRNERVTPSRGLQIGVYGVPALLLGLALLFGCEDKILQNQEQIAESEVLE